MLRRVAGRHVFITYDRGVLELMLPSYAHDVVARLLCRLIQALAEELGIPIRSAGSTTWRRRRKQAGLEADESFYIRNQPAIQGKREIDLRLDPPPDLAVEIEISRRLGSRLRVYGRLGIPEVWRYRPGTLTVLLLQPNGKYLASPTSPSFPGIPVAELARFIDRGLDADETVWIAEFRQWVRRQVRTRQP